MNINAQTLDTYQWKKHLDNNTLTYYQKRDSAEQFFSQNDSLKEIRKYGYKDFFRWCFYWENRLDENGFTINLPKKLDSLLNNGASAFQNKSNSTHLEPWFPVGLDKKPIDRVFSLGGIGFGGSRAGTGFASQPKITIKTWGDWDEDTSESEEEHASWEESNSEYSFWYFSTIFTSKC